MSSVMHPIPYYVLNTLLFAGWCTSFALLFPRKQNISDPVYYLVHILALFGYYLAPFLPAMSQLRFLLGIFVACIPAITLYEGKWYHKTIIGILAVMSVVPTELLVFMLFPDGTFSQSIPISEQILIDLIYLSLNLFIIGLIVLAVRMIRKQRNTTAIPNISLLFFLFPVSQYAAFSGWFQPITAENTKMSLVMFLVLLLQIVADVGLAFAMVATSQSAELRVRNAMLETQVTAQQEYYASQAEHFEQIRRMRHDIDNHLYTIRSLLADGKSDAAAEYADELYAVKLYARPILDGCENTVAASFLLHRKEELEEKEIPLRCSISLPVRIGISNMDLITALGNLLDNAEDACLSPEEKFIDLTISFQNPYLHITVRNPLPARPVRKPQRIPDLNRGVGFTILNKLAEKYDGDFSTEEKNGNYKASLLLKASQESA